MKKQSSLAEDVFVLEMILHGRPQLAIKKAFPLMQEAFLPEAISYMLDDPFVKRRINAGILYYYKDYAADIDIPELPVITLAERKEFLYKIISGKRKYPAYIRDEKGLSMIMTLAEPAAINDALKMDEELDAIEATVKQPQYLVYRS